MQTYLKIGVSLIVIMVIGLYIYMDNNEKSMVDLQNQTQEITVEIAKKTEIKEKFTSKKDIKKLKYTKVALPKKIREIEHDLVDIQNSILRDKAQLDSEANVKLTNHDIDEDIKTTNMMIAKLNKELDIAPEKIEEIDNSYIAVLNTKPTTPRSKEIDKKLLNIDKDILKLESEFDKLQKGDVK